MATFEIDLSVRTHLTVEVEAKNADAAWRIADEMIRANGCDTPVKGTVRTMYVDEVDQVRLKKGEVT